MGQTKICRYCGNVIYSDEQTCEFCGKFLNKEHDNKDLFCAKCKAPVNTDDNYCQHCGAIFNLEAADKLNEESLKHNINGIPYNLGVLLTSFALSIGITVFNTVGKDITIGKIFAIFGISFIASEILLYIYFLPSILAIENNNRNVYFIYVCNLLFGATVIGWIIALVFALRSNQKK